MVYLGGIASIAGSIIGAIIYTILLEILRPMGVWRMVLMPLMLVLLMIYRSARHHGPARSKNSLCRCAICSLA